MNFYAFLQIKNILSLEVVHFTDTSFAKSNFLQILPYNLFLSLAFTCNNVHFTLKFMFLTCKINNINDISNNVKRYVIKC